MYRAGKASQFLYRRKIEVWGRKQVMGKRRLVARVKFALSMLKKYLNL